MIKIGPLEWSPRDPSRIFQKLRKLAPSIAFDVEHTHDPNFVWDGDGPDPSEENYLPYDVDVYARTIENGEILEGQRSMGGVYEIPEKIDLGIGGYLPQMLKEAIDELGTQVKEGQVLEQVTAARQYLKEFMRIRYESQARRPHG
jgi:hypothetical protein